MAMKFHSIALGNCFYYIGWVLFYWFRIWTFFFFFKNCYMTTDVGVMSSKPCDTFMKLLSHHKHRRTNVKLLIIYSFSMFNKHTLDKIIQNSFLRLPVLHSCSITKCFLIDFLHCVSYYAIWINMSHRKVYYWTWSIGRGGSVKQNQ